MRATGGIAHCLHYGIGTPHHSPHEASACIQPACAPPRQPRFQTLLHHLLRHNPLWPPALIHHSAPPAALKVYYEVNGGSDSQGHNEIPFAR